MIVRLLKVSEECTCIEFTREQGDAEYFFEMFNYFKEKLGDLDDMDSPADDLKIKEVEAYEKQNAEQRNEET